MFILGLHCWACNTIMLNTSPHCSIVEVVEQVTVPSLTPPQSSTRRVAASLFSLSLHHVPHSLECRLASFVVIFRQKITVCCDEEVL